MLSCYSPSRTCKPWQTPAGLSPSLNWTWAPTPHSLTRWQISLPFAAQWSTRRFPTSHETCPERNADSWIIRKSWIAKGLRLRARSGSKERNRTTGKIHSDQFQTIIFSPQVGWKVWFWTSIWKCVPLWGDPVQGDWTQESWGPWSASTNLSLQPWPLCLLQTFRARPRNIFPTWRGPSHVWNFTLNLWMSWQQKLRQESTSSQPRTVLRLVFCTLSCPPQMHYSTALPCFSVDLLQQEVANSSWASATLRLHLLLGLAVSLCLLQRWFVHLWIIRIIMIIVKWQ